ncbi:MAG TPA: PAS domain S-box protein [Xanthobacteraceae bacterium]|nr:PAS domain S-box protein [Xanthobacteraceae bacterium]
MSGQESKTLSAPPGLDAFRTIDQRALDAIPTGLCVCRADGGLVRYNERAVELWGRAPPLEDPRARDGGSFRRYGSQGKPLAFEATPVAAALRTGESVLGAELVIERPDGSRLPVLMNAAPLKDQLGGIVGAVCSFQELTERKRTEEALRASEAELQSVINRTPFMLVRCSGDYRYRFISDAYGQMLGRHRNEIIGKTIAEILGQQGFAALRPYIERVLRGEEVEFECELDLARIGRRCFYIAYRPERDANGAIGGWIASLLDVTEERHGEAARRLLASIVESSDDAIISKDLDGIIVSWNPGAQRLFGYSAEEVVGKPITIIIPEGLRGEEPVILGRIRCGERIEHFETVRRCKDGRLVDISLTISPMRNERGTVVGASKIARDITARKQAEAVMARRADEQAALYRFTDKLYRSTSLEEIYDAALDAIAAAMHCDRASILRCDADGVMRFAAWRGLSDRYRSVVEGHSPWAAGETNPEPVCLSDTAAADLDPRIGAAVQREGIGALAFIPLMAEGRLIGKFMPYYDAPREFGREDVDLALTLARQLGFAIERMLAERVRAGMEAELRAISEKLEAEVERRTLERDRIWNVSEDLLAVCNFEGYFLSLNPAWTRLLGWSEDEIKALHVSDLRHPDDAPNAVAGRAQLAQGVPTVRMENRFRHKDGSWRWLQWTMTANNGLIYVAGRHVTAEKEAAAALERAQRQAAHLQKMDAIGQLTGGIAHDFNNLLMIVSGHAQRLKGRLHDAKDARALAAIEMAASRGENLTRQLLSFSRTLPLNPTVVDPAEAVQAIRDVLAGSMHVNIEFKIDVPDTTWPVCVDKSELDLALINLSVNARDAMPEGGRIVIAAENVHFDAGTAPEGLATAGDFVALSVVDSGGGIPSDLLSRVVEPFFTTKGPDKGTGLGLSQVYGFGRRSAGTVVIDSEIGRGTKVTIYLPRTHAAVTAPSPQDHGQYVSPGQQTILVVEDNPDVRHVAVALLEQLGYRTIEVENAEAALDVLAAGKSIALLFSDVVLPGHTDGLALARITAARYPDIPVVLTTGYTKVFGTTPEFPVLRKPYQISALGRVIQQSLNPPSPTSSALAG